MYTLAYLLLISAPNATPIDFDTQIIPLLTKAGCNAGSCHGAASGRGGFHLSLWGSNPAEDYRAIVRELGGRRINLAHPKKSLFVLKPTRQLAHEGGQRFSEDSEDAQLLLDWIRAGAIRPQSRTLTHFAITPSQTTLDKVGQKVTLKANATFDTQQAVDVTRHTVFTSTDEGAVQVDKQGNVTVLRPGRHTILARYLDRVVPVTVILPYRDSAVNLSQSPRHNFIDTHILRSLEALRIEPSAQANDAMFLRRVTLDLTGTLPTPKEMLGFLQDTRTDKRKRVIDRLLSSANFVDYWTLRWGNLLQINSRLLGKPGALAFHRWVREQLVENTPLDVMARKMILSVGNSTNIGPANFSRVPNNPRTHAEYFSRVFLGVRLRCANCHDHPLDRWTQDDYHGLAAIFAKLERGQTVKVVSFGEVTHPRTGEPAVFRIPGERFLDEPKDARVDLADWLLTTDNPQFARIMANRLWKALMGRGLVEPVDDLRSTNPATHPELLNRLAKYLIEQKYDLRKMLRLIATSATYQRSSLPTAENRNDDRFYSHVLIRPLPAEVLADALVTVTGVANKYGELPLGTRAITLHDSQINAPSLDILGRCSRAESCESTMNVVGLDKTLHLINGELINKKITDKKNNLYQLLDKNESNLEILRRLYLLALNRYPTEVEEETWKGLLPADLGKRRKHFEDFLWALLTSKEFTSNH